MALELVCRKQHDFKRDIVGLGIVVIEMMEHEPPYFRETVLNTLKLIAKNGTPMLKEPKRWSQVLLNFLSGCLCAYQSLRYTADEVLRHPFLQEGCSKAEIAALVSERIAKQRIELASDFLTFRVYTRSLDYGRRSRRTIQRIRRPLKR